MKTQPKLTSSAARILGMAFVILAVSAILRAEPASSDKIARFAIGAEIGTAGYGPIVTFTANKRFTASVGYTFFSYDKDVSDDDGDYNGKLKFSNLQAMLNWHPMAGSFHISAGAVLTNNKVDVVGKPKSDATYTIGDTVYTGAQVGRLDGTVELSKGAAPYVGIGWSKRPTADGFGFFFNMGVMFTDSPSATLRASGPIASDPTFQSDLRNEQQKVNDELDGFKYYPVIQLGLFYRF